MCLGALLLTVSVTGCSGSDSASAYGSTSGSEGQTAVSQTSALQTSESRQSAGANPEPAETTAGEEASAETSSAAAESPAVYTTRDISPEGLMAVYEALGAELPEGNIAVKISTGENGSNYLRPELIGDLVQAVDGTIVECNTAYGGNRANTAYHMQLAEDHGYTAIADVDIMDAEGSMTLPVNGGSRITENYVGSHFADYDYYVVLSHFKGHAMAGFGGAIKNISIGIASSEGKSHIHSGGTGGNMWSGEQDAFLESMAEAGKSVSDYMDGNMLYINVMNRLSVDCDCDGNPAEPDMHDIGSDFSKNLGRKEVFRFTLTKNRLKYTTKYSIYTTKWPFWNEM